MTALKKVALIGAKGMLASQVMALAPADVEIHPFDSIYFRLILKGYMTVFRCHKLLNPQF